MIEIKVAGTTTKQCSVAFAGRVAVGWVGRCTSSEDLNSAVTFSKPLGGGKGITLAGACCDT